METIVLVIHLLIAIALVGVVLLQRSEGGLGGLGGSGGGGGGGMGGLIGNRTSANLLTRATAVLAAAFMATSIGLAVLAGTHRSSTPGVIVGEEPAPGDEGAPADAPATPATPSVPTSE